jgi:O-acetylhomoserine/O-acetylserine sulfhydrylase-like pyridoxal-dependent enzyme
MKDGKKFGFTTTILHSDRQKPIEHGSLHKPIHTAVAYGYRDARELADVFQGKKPGYRYGRQGNPTVTALEEKISRMEEGVSTLCFATGMAAIGALVQGLLRTGDHVVSESLHFVSECYMESNRVYIFKFCISCLARQVLIVCYKKFAHFPLSTALFCHCSQSLALSSCL